MPARNSDTRFGTVTRTFHWLVALLILTAIPLGVIANQLPYDTAEALARKAQLSPGTRRWDLPPSSSGRRASSGRSSNGTRHRCTPIARPS